MALTPYPIPKVSNRFMKSMIKFGPFNKDKKKWNLSQRCLIPLNKRKKKLKKVAYTTIKGLQITK